jgi:hypothetical protein
VFLQQPAGQLVAGLAGSRLPLIKRDQTIFPIDTEHLVEGLAGLLQKLATTFRQIRCGVLGEHHNPP